MKLLLVDDEEKFVSRLAERLAFRGYDADWATTCDDALAKAKSGQHDIAVLDIKMPAVSGFDLKKKLAEIVPGMKFIFVTGHGSEQDYDSGCKEAVCCIIKPFQIEMLIEKIREASAVSK
ncbi:MAG: response regulator [Deltaproteobacteria bacterium]|nr:response regulator [Deltaproteobacteria bacterium]